MQNTKKALEVSQTEVSFSYKKTIFHFFFSFLSFLSFFFKYRVLVLNVHYVLNMKFLHRQSNVGQRDKRKHVATKKIQVDYKYTIGYNGHCR